jgi:hypothetical protein
MSDDLSILFDRIRTLLDEDDQRRRVGGEAVELTLTDGYARALALDGERLRVEAQVLELAGSDEHVGEVRILKARLVLLEEELAQLRSLLGTLSAHR